MSDILFQKNPEVKLFYENLCLEQQRIYGEYKAYYNNKTYFLNQMLISDPKTALATYGYEDQVLNSLMQNFNLDNELILYKATSRNRVMGFIKDAIYTNAEYLSTAISLDKIQGFFTYGADNVFLEIHLHNHVIACPFQINDMDNDEGEILLPRNTKFKILEDTILKGRELLRVMDPELADESAELQYYKLLYLE